jgi:hypothetical protein
MARFYGGVSGRARTEATRLGSRGLRTFCNGWRRGVQVSAWGSDDGSDSFTVTITGGSGYGRSFTLASIEDDIATIYHPVSGRQLAKARLRD